MASCTPTSLELTVISSGTFEEGIHYLVTSDTTTFYLPDVSSLSIGNVVKIDKLISVTPTYEVNGDNSEMITSDGSTYDTQATHTGNITAIFVFNGTNWEI